MLGALLALGYAVAMGGSNILARRGVLWSSSRFITSISIFAGPPFFVLVVCVTGDGGFGMLMADFTTAVYNRLPIKVVLFNDGKLKNIEKEQMMYGYKEFGTAFVNPDFADFAKSCGGEGYRVEKPGELDGALERAFKSANPVIVDVLVDPDEMAPIVKMTED